MGILSGAMGGFGGAVADIAGGHIKNEINLDYQSQMMAMQEQRDARADERRQRMKRDDDQYTFDKKVERNPQEVEMEVDKKRAVGDVENDQMRTREDNRRVDDLGFKVENLGDMASVEREMTKARDLDKDSEGRRLRNELTGEQISDRQQIRKDREERSKTIDELNAAVDANDRPSIERAQRKLDGLNRKASHIDPMSSHVSAAKAILADIEASQDEKARARSYLAGALNGSGVAADVPQTKTVQGKTYKKVDGGWQLVK